MKIPQIEYDDNLKPFTSNKLQLIEYICYLNEIFSNTNLSDQQVKLRGEIAVYCNACSKYDDAEQLLLMNLRQIQRHKLPKFRKVQNEIRLAHVYQLQKNFEKSNELFKQLQTHAKSKSHYARYADFIYQHSGKNLFDQKNFKKARKQFEKALALRVKNNSPEDQIISSIDGLLACDLILKN